MEEREFDGSRLYVDLNRDEFIRFRLLLARINGPLRMRIPTLVMSIICFVLLIVIAVEEWIYYGREGFPDPVLLVGALLVLLPGLFIYYYVPFKMKKTAALQFDRSVDAGVTYFGELRVYPDCIEKISDFGTAHIRLDERVLFIETAEMMVFSAANSPALVLPARCMTAEMAALVRAAADRLPVNHRRFIQRLQPEGQPVSAPPHREPPEELWVNTFTYTPEEYVTVLKGIIFGNYWRVAPMLAIGSMIISLLINYGDIDLIKSVLVFLVAFGIGTLMNLVFPLSRIKRNVMMLSAHDMTMQVRMDTMSLRFKVPKGGEGAVLWCDVDHVYEKEEFVEIVHNKRTALYIPKRAIADLKELDAVITRCRNKH